MFALERAFVKYPGKEIRTKILCYSASQAVNSRRRSSTRCNRSGSEMNRTPVIRMAMRISGTEEAYTRGLTVPSVVGDLAVTECGEPENQGTKEPENQPANVDWFSGSPGVGDAGRRV